MTLQADAFDGRLVISGIAGPAIARLSVSTPAGPRPLVISDRRAYLAVLAGTIGDLPRYPLTATLRSGERLAYDWVSAPPRRR